MKLEQNVGPLDRATRVILGLLLAAGIYWARVGGVWGGLLFWAGIITVGEGIVGYCLLYGILGWSTKRRIY